MKWPNGKERVYNVTVRVDTETLGVVIFTFYACKGVRFLNCDLSLKLAVAIDRNDFGLYRSTYKYTGLIFNVGLTY